LDGKGVGHAGFLCGKLLARMGSRFEPNETEQKPKPTNPLPGSGFQEWQVLTRNFESQQNTFCRDSFFKTSDI
jgi:hypothetical protein